MNQQSRTIAIFDFDGTITTKSTTSAFLSYVVGKRSFYLRIFTLPIVLLNKLKLISEDELNNHLIKYCLKGYSLSFLQGKGRLFAQFEIKKVLKKEALNKIKYHQSLGHFCILATAAYDVYVEHWAKLYNFDAVVCTKLEFDKKQCATGRIMDTTCSHVEKLIQIKKVIGEEKAIIYAYGDSEGDKEMLDFATYPYYQSFDKLYDPKLSHKY